MDLRRLRLLRELDRRGTVTAVAAALHYSPSTVSQQLSVLEAETGVPLLEPAGRRVRLTPQAAILVTHTEIVLRQLETAEAEIARSLNEPSGTVRVASFQTGLLGLLPPVLTALRAEYPGLRVEVFQAEPHVALPKLLAHDYDVVVAEEYPGHPLPRPTEIDYRELAHDPLRLALPPSVEGDPWAAAAALPWTVEPPGTRSRDWVLGLCRAAGFEPDLRFATDDLLVAHRLVVEGHAVAVLPDLLWREHRPRARLVELPHARRLVAACRAEAAAHPAVEACRAAFAAAT